MAHSKRGSSHIKRILQANSNSNLVIPFGPAGTELGLLYLRECILRIIVLPSRETVKSSPIT